MPLKREWFRQIYWLPVAVLILGLLSITMVIWINQIAESGSIAFGVLDAAMEVRIHVAASHIKLEEGISGDAPIDIEKIFSKIDLAISLAEALVNGGRSKHGLPLQPLKDSKERKNVQVIHSLLTQYKALALERVQDMNAARISSDHYDRFHAVFNEITDRAEALEIAFEKDQVRSRAKAKSLFLAILLAWIFIVVGATVGLRSREARRQAAEKALQRANEHLEVQATKLDTFREHLMDLVEKRTLQLTISNRDLRKEINERKETEKSLRASENKFRTLVENLPQDVFLKDKNSIYLYSNENYARHLKVNTDEMIGKTDYDCCPGGLVEREIEEDKRILDSGKAEEIEERYVSEGHEVVIHKIKSPIKNDRGEIVGILGILWDITERRRLESIAEATNMMENIGYVFSGIRHEIGNPINSIKMTLGALANKLEISSTETIKKYIELLAAEISRVEYLLRTLKSFNMYETPDLQNVEMKPFLDKFLSILTDDFGKKGIAIERVHSLDAQWGYVDSRALQQVMLNIMSNAADALEGSETPKIVIDVLKTNGRINITVTDNGVGMSEEQQEELFKPFRTTKPGGTGLGLVIAKKMLTRMNGAIEMKSKKGEGTTVNIFIPEGMERSQ